MEDSINIDDPCLKDQDKLGILKYEKNLSKSINQLSISSSIITLNLIDSITKSTNSMSECSVKINDWEREKIETKGAMENIQAPVNESLNDINSNNENKSEFKLKSPYGSWCAFE